MNEIAPDAILLRRYAEEKSDAAFAELVRRHVDLVYSAALRQVGGDAHHAQDVVQTVFTLLASKAGSVAKHPVLIGWLYTTTQHAAAKIRRTEGRRSTRELAAHLMHEMNSPAIEWEQLRPVLDDAMRNLNDRDREAVLLRFFAARPFTEIGVALNLSEDAARMRVERALEKLHALLARRGVTSTSAALAVVLANQAVAAAPVGLAASVTGSVLAAGGSTMLASGVFTFMSTSKLAVGVATFLVAIGVGSAIYEANLAKQTATELAVLRRQQVAVAVKAADLEVKLRSAEQSNETAAARIAALEKDLAQARKSVAGAVPRPAAAVADSAASIWGNPAYTRAYVEKFRTSLALRYGPLYRALNLSPDQIARFEAALTEGQQGAMDIWTAASAQGLPTDSGSATTTSIARMTSEPLGSAQAVVKALLGEDNYEKYRQFDKAQSARDLVASLAGNVYYSEMPLTAQQGEALTGILSANTKKIRIPMTSDGKTPLYRDAEATEWEAVNTQAQTLLSPSQLAALRTLTEQKRLDREMNQVLNPPVTKQPGG